MPRLPLRDLKGVIGEQQALVGGRIDNVFQCEPRLFVLRIDPGKRMLVCDLTPGRARCVLTDAPPALPETPPVLAAILRTALRGGLIEAIFLPAEDRVVFLDVSGARGRYRLVLELFPRFPNLLLLDAEGRVERTLDGEAARRRNHPVGSPYSLPPAPTLPPEESLGGNARGGEFPLNHEIDRLFREPAVPEESRDSERVIARLRKMRENLSRDLREVEDPDRLREQGRILLAGFDRLRKGTANFEGVAIDPGLEPHENVDRVFERARKAERARPALERRAAEVDAMIARAEAGDLPPAVALQGRRGEKPAPRLPYRVFRSVEGRRILVGKGGRDNDETTLRVAGPHDIFLHVRGTPGAHVIVPLERGEEIGEQTLLDAATLALHYSRNRRADRAEITWTPRRHVSKPKGAKPGLVAVTHERVLRLRREPDRLARLLMSVGETE